MKIEKAITLSIGELGNPVLTGFQFGKAIYELYRAGSYKGEALNITKEVVSISDFRRYLKGMIDLGVLKEHPNFKGRAYLILGRKVDNAGEVVCAVDPFAYLSHLSAMEYHGLTDRIPLKLYVSSPSSKLWKEEADIRMRVELGEEDASEYRKAEMPLLRKPSLVKVGKREVSCYNSSHRGAYINARDGNMRVSSIGRTFLDMLRNPDLCGGMRHVVDVFKEYCEDYILLIVDEINQHGKAIDKVRAGYIMEVLCDVDDEKVSSWSDFAQRGGSRKLDASAEYVPEWSEKWKISLNLF